MNKLQYSRRDFIGKAATISAIGFAAPHLMAANTAESDKVKPGPNSRLHIGLIGCGGMGRSNLLNCAKYPDVVVAAVCDVQKDRRDKLAEKFKDSCKVYSDFRELLQQPDLDGVIIATPPHWHALIAIAACQAGKDIYLQKPMTMHLGESFAVRNAVRRHQRICQVGTQIHALDNYRRVVEFIQAGNLGEIGTVRTFNVLNQGPGGLGTAPDTTVPAGVDWDFWCGPAPKRPYNKILAETSYNHCSWMDYSGGWTPGMAPHIIDLPVWALNLGFPTRVSASGGRFIIKDDGDAYDNHEVVWQYPNRTMTWMTSLTNSYGFDFNGAPGRKRRLGIYFHGTQATLWADYMTHKVLAESEKPVEIPAPPQSIPPSPGHEREWLDSIVSRKQPSCNVEYHIKIDVPIVLSVLSYKLGRSIQFDPVKEQIIGDREAAKCAIPEYRSPWKFPKEYLKG